MPRKTARTLFLVVTTFMLLAVGIVGLRLIDVVSPAVGLLMLVALLGLYIGFGVLIAVYRLISRLE